MLEEDVVLVQVFVAQAGLGYPGEQVLARLQLGEEPSLALILPLAG